MIKLNRILPITAFFILSFGVFVGLMIDIIPAFPEHGVSMIIGSIAYIAMLGIVLTISFENNVYSLLSGIIGTVFAGAHIFQSGSFFSIRIGTPITHLFGYFAAAALFCSGIYALRKTAQWSNKKIWVSGSMTAGITFVFWHVASIEVLRGSFLFFGPFTLLFFWTIGQFANQVFQEVITKKSLYRY